MIYEARYICKSCKQTFDIPKRTPYGGEYDEPWYVCPYCECDDFDTACKCIICGDIFASDSLKYGICKTCLDKSLAEKAAEYCRSDDDIYDDFAWWLHGKVTTL